MRRLVFTGLAVCIATGLVGGTAFAGKTRTNVSLDNPEAGIYEGQVTAKKPCKEGRKVEVWHDTNGNGKVDGEPTDFKIGTDKTDKDGFYLVSGNQAPAGDNIIVVVKPNKQCKGAKAVTEAESHLEF